MEKGNLFKVKVKTEIKGLIEIFPLGFETMCYSTYTTEDLISDGYWTKIRNERIWVEPKIKPKGSLKDIVVIGTNGKEYSSTLIHNWTGKYMSQIFDRIND